MKKFTFKSLTLKLLALVVAVCAGVAVATVSSEKPVAFAAEAQESVFAIQGAGIRYPEVADEVVDGEEKFYKGIRFETKLSKSWLDVNDAEKVGKYYYGTLIFPAKNIGAFDENLGSTANKENLEAVKVIRGQGEALTEDVTFYASLVYDSETIAELFGNKFETSLTEAQLEKVLKHLYAMDMTAISYVQFGDTIKYSAPYTDSMIKVAARLQSNKDWAERAKAYLGDGEVETIKTYAVDDNNIVKGFDAQNVSIVAIGNETLTAGVDYNIVDGKLVFTDRVVKANIATYKDVFVFDANNNLTIVNVLFATDEIKTAQDFVSKITYGNPTEKDHETYYAAYYTPEEERTEAQKAAIVEYETRFAPKDGAYVLANDIDMTGASIVNMLAYEQFGAHKLNYITNAGFYGIFDGFGHTISNPLVHLVTTTLTFSSDKAPVIQANGLITSANKRISTVGMFPNVKKGAEIRNVAFVNVKGNAYQTNKKGIGNSYTGLLTRDFAGTLENVYFDVNPDCIEYSTGILSRVESTATIKNVYVNYPKTGYTFDYSVESTVGRVMALYGANAFGSFASEVNLSAKYENVYVSSPMPVAYYRYSSDVANDYFVYAENETELWDGDEGNFEKRVSGIRHYMSNDKIALDGSDENAKMVEAFKNSGMFKVVNGQLIWHNAQLEVTDSTAIDYEASTGTVDSSLFNSIKGIEKITVNGIELTENNGFNYVGDKVVLNSRKSAEDTSAGVPYISKYKVADPDQTLTIVVENKDAIYTFTNVTYWTEIITTAQEFEDTLDYGLYDANKTYVRHDGLYSLGNDIDLTGYVIENQIGNSYSAKDQLKDTGLYGIFDGRGHTIYNATVDMDRGYSVNVMNTGLFGVVSGGTSLASVGAIRNVAIINVLGTNKQTNPSFRSCNGLIASSYNNGGFLGVMENVYVEINPETSPYFAGIIDVVDTWSRTKLRNIVVKYDREVFDYEKEMGSQRMNVPYQIDGLGTLFGREGNDATHKNISNIYSISPMPISAIRMNSISHTVDYDVNGDGVVDTKDKVATKYSLYMDDLDNDYFFYGENEETLWVKHPVLDTLDPDNKGKHTVQTVFANNPTGKARVLAGIRRYDNMGAFTADTSDENQTMTEALIDTGLFKVVDGQILWHTQNPTYQITTPIDFDASTGKLGTTEIDWEKVISVSVGSELLTLENGGIIKLDDNSYVLRAKESLEDPNPGVPFIDNTQNTLDQNLTFNVKTKDKNYNFTNVNYWTSIITTASEFKASIEYVPTILYGGNTYNKGLYKLANDIDFVNEDGSLVTMDYGSASTGNIIYTGGTTGFAGIFDGDGHVIKNFHTKYYGLFASLSSANINGNPVEVKNFAMTNVVTEYKFDGKNTTYGNIIACCMYYNSSTTITVENVYVQVDPKYHLAYGIIYVPSAQLVMNNVYVDYQKARIEAPARYTFDKDYSEDGKTYITLMGNVDNTALCHSSTLFNTITNVVDTNVTNVYIASSQAVTWKNTNAGATYSNLFKHDATNKVHTFNNNGTAIGSTSKFAALYGFASNETRSYIPVIKEMKPAFAEISVTDGYFANTKYTGFYCDTCHTPYSDVVGVKGDACTNGDCQGTLIGCEYYGLWGDMRSYIWTFFDIGEGYVNQPLSATNGIWKFTGVKKYDTPALMAQAGNDYSSFTGENGNGCWKVVEGALTWATL